MLRQEDLQIVLEVLPDPGPALEAVEQIGRALDEVFEGERDVRVPTPVPVPVTGARPPLSPPAPPVTGGPRPVPEAVEAAVPAAPPPPPTTVAAAAPPATEPGAAAPSPPPLTQQPAPPAPAVPPPPVPPPEVIIPPAPPPQRPPPALPPEAFGPVRLLWPEGPPPALRWPEGEAPALSAPVATGAGKDRPAHVHVDKEAPAVLLKREQAAEDERLNAPPPAADLLGALRSSLGDRLGELVGKFAGPAGQEVTRDFVTEGKLPDVGGLLSSLGGKGGSGAGNLVGSLAGAVGPYAALIAAAPQLAESVGQLGAAPFKVAGKGLDAVGSGLRELQGELGPVGLALGAVEGVFSGVGEAARNIPVVGELIAPLADTLAGLVKPVRDIVGSLMSMASKASPAHARQWQFMLNDVQAVVGRGFLPFFNMMLEFGRDFGRLAATVLPNASEMSAAIAPLNDAWQDLRVSLRQATAEFGPQVRLVLVGGVRLLSQGVADVTRSVTAFTQALTRASGPLGSLTQTLVRLGLVRGLEGSEGAAARPAMLGDIASYQASIYEGAYSQAISGPNDPANRSATTLERIYDLLRTAGLSNLWQNRRNAQGQEIQGSSAIGALGNTYADLFLFRGLQRALQGW